MNQALEIADSIECYDMSYEKNALQIGMEEIEKFSKQNGIKF